MFKRATCTAGAVMVFLMAAAAQAVIYKWTDEKGKVQYSQTPPPGVNAALIEPAAPPPNAGQSDEALQKRLEGFEQRREAREKSKAEQAGEKEAQKIRAENCQRARDDLATLQAHGRISIKEGDTYRALTEEERQAKISEAQAHVDEFCNEVANSK
jgi:hypothetical protein